jgi:hypothetical protein
MNRYVIIGITLLLSASLFRYLGGVTPTPIHPEGKSTPAVQATPAIQVTPTSTPSATSRPSSTQAPSPTVTTTQAPSPAPTIQPTPTVEATPVVQDEETMVRNLVQEFGQKLQMVSLSASQSLISQSMRENYGDFLSPALLQKWQKDPKQALGRMVSSPWPDRIEILNMEKTSPSKYQISGEVIEITSVEKLEGGAAAKRPVILKVKKNVDGARISGRWWIDEVTAGSYVNPESLTYINPQYGFYFSLPESWQGYTIVMNQWEGLAIGDAEVVETGPRISIRHPEWTSQIPRQDIPIMVFTQAEWKKLQQEKFHIGAAPIGPSELGRNRDYVFALPARYNYAFPAGFEEVEEILRDKPLQTLNLSK